ncbi:PilZ domain-containing protein [Motilibacter aurantiacus]|uniref:PilZ domain-containing protein n=1 Tax=Motilibacter aurantiacus TaxID=2714955 RepID=UPI00140DCC21|nr:PilZ domain-containing protein [Motilibacter aurantiacus]NHC45010.1 PilZ domain-containing protein [Motilibacter aurantiacus]
MDVTTGEAPAGPEAPARPSVSVPDADVPDADVPEPGAPMTLLPTGRADLLTGRVVAWTPELDTVGVEAVADLSPHPVESVCGEKVWASVRTAGTNSLLALSAEARPSGHPHHVRLAGRVLAREPRRDAVRAPAQLHVTLSGRGSFPECAGHTLDVSRSGCRVVLDLTDQLRAGQSVSAAITVHGAEFTISSRVERVEPSGRVVALRFLDLPIELADVLDRLAFESLG